MTGDRLRFAFTLAHSKGKTVQELFTGVPGLAADEFDYWRAFDRIDPVGAWRADWRAANIAAILHNVNLGVDGEPVSAAEYLWKKPTPFVEKTEEQIEASMGPWLAKAG